MGDIPDYTMKPTFPIASVIDAAQRNNALQLQAQQAGQQSLIQGLQSIGQVGQSLYQRKLQMAQALAGAKMYAASPEGQQMLGTNQVSSGPAGQAVTPNTTAAYNPDAGTVAPNQSHLNLGDIQTAMMGEKPMDVQNQLFERQKQAQKNAIDQGELALKQKMQPQELAVNTQIKNLLASIDASKAKTEAVHVEDQATDALLARKAQLTSDLPASWVTGAFAGDKANSARQQIEQIDAELAKRGFTKGSTQGQSFTTPGGIPYTRG